MSIFIDLVYILISFLWLANLDIKVMDWGKVMVCLVRLAMASCVYQLVRANSQQKLLRSKPFSVIVIFYSFLQQSCDFMSFKVIL
jgi:hypothetical protein